MTGNRRPRSQAESTQPTAARPSPDDEDRECFALYAEDAEGLRSKLNSAIGDATEYLDALMAHEGMDTTFLDAAPSKFVQINAEGRNKPSAYKSADPDAIEVRKVCAALSSRAARSRLTERATYFEATGDLVSAASLALDGMRYALQAAGELLGMEVDQRPAREKRAGDNAIRKNSAIAADVRHNKPGGARERKAKVRAEYLAGKAARRWETKEDCATVLADEGWGVRSTLYGYLKGFKVPTA